ncbi:MAG: hypothetical protein V1744_00140 [Candidatus Altiarchaeota archaeon]
MLRQKTPKIQGDNLSNINLKGFKSSLRLASKGAGLKLASIMDFVNLGENNLSMQGCYVAMLRRMASRIRDKGVRDNVRKKLDSVSKLNNEQYDTLESIRAQISKSGQNEF